MTANKAMNSNAATPGITLTQKRAQHAWNAVQRAEKGTGPHKNQELEKFWNEVMKLPIRVLTSGLAKTLAYLQAKGEVPGLLWELSDWVLRQRFGFTDADGDLLEFVLKSDSDFLRRATEEVLEYSEWLTRFCKAAEGGGDDEF